MTMTIFETNNGHLINLNEITAVDHGDDGSVTVHRGGNVTRLSGQNASRFKEATKSDSGRVAELARIFGEQS
jgi:hypothetical protein